MFNKVVLNSLALFLEYRFPALRDDGPPFPEAWRSFVLHNFELRGIQDREMMGMKNHPLLGVLL